MDIHCKDHLQIFGLCLLAPDPCPIVEVFLIGDTFCLGHDIQCDGHAAVICHVLTDDKGSVDLAPGELNAVKLRNHLVDLSLESGKVLCRPPVIDIAVLVTLGAVAVKSVGDLMTDDTADTA